MKSQGWLLKNHADFIVPLPCLMPLASSGLKSAPFVKAGLIFFKLLGFVAGVKPLESRIISGGEFDAIFPELKGKAPNGALLWHDAILNNPQGLAIKLKLEIASNAAVFENTAVSKIKYEDGVYAISAGEHSYKAKVVINAAARGADEIMLENIEYKRPCVKWVKAFNLIFRMNKQLSHAIGLSSSAGRLYFYTPRTMQLAAGTFYYPLSDDFNCQPTEEQIIEAIQELNSAASEFSLNYNDLIGVEAGTLAAHSADKDVKLVDHEIINDCRGYIDLISVKYTTFPELGKRLFEKAVKYL